MTVTFISTLDSISEDSVARFVDRPGGYDIPTQPDDIKAILKACFQSGQAVEITCDDSTRLIIDARPVE